MTVMLRCLRNQRHTRIIVLFGIIIFILFVMSCLMMNNYETGARLVFPIVIAKFAEILKPELSVQRTRPSYENAIPLTMHDMPPFEIPVNATGVIAENLFLASITKAEIDCPVANVTRFGNRGEGGWELCQYGPFELKEPCLVYSFGISNEWSFDDSVVSRHRCIVRAFDPSMNTSNHKRGSNILFYNEGISGSDKVNSGANTWQLKSLGTFLRQFQELEVDIDYMKIDVEYSEWETLEAALADGSLSNVKQLALEIHLKEIFSQTSSVDDYRSYMKVFRGLQTAGFRRWYWHLNPLSINVVSRHSRRVIMCCYELVYLNTKYFNS